MKPNMERLLIAVLWILGVASLAFGMTRRNHPFFIAGVLFVIVGYLLVRKVLKRR